MNVKSIRKWKRSKSHWIRKWSRKEFEREIEVNGKRMWEWHWGEIEVKSKVCVKWRRGEVETEIRVAPKWVRKWDQRKTTMYLKVKSKWDGSECECESKRTRNRFERVSEVTSMWMRKWIPNEFGRIPKVNSNIKAKWLRSDIKVMLKWIRKWGQSGIEGESGVQPKWRRIDWTVETKRNQRQSEGGTKSNWI